MPSQPDKTHWNLASFHAPSQESTKRFVLFYIIINGLLLAYLITEKVMVQDIHAIEKSDRTNSTYPSDVGFESTPCEVDSECDRFRQLMASWPAAKPKAAIYVLTEPHKRGNKTKDMLASLFKYFNHKFEYPVILFYTGNTGNKTDELLPVGTSRELIFMQQIVFHLPHYLPNKTTTCPHGLGYRHMCRFHANTVYTHPIFQDLEFAWRLDDDSLLLGPNIDYDVFKFMKDHDLVYGYNAIDRDIPPCAVGLWRAAVNYMNHSHIRDQYLSRWPRYWMFYNNFEISNLSIWRSKEYRGFMRYIDDLGGIYKYRWGDAPMKSLALAMFVSPEKIHKFKHIGYQHQKKKIQGSSHTLKVELLTKDLKITAP